MGGWAPGSLGWYRLGLSVLERLEVTPAPASEDGRAAVEYWGDGIIFVVQPTHIPCFCDFIFMLAKSVRMMRGTFGESLAERRSEDLGPLVMPFS